MEIQNFKQMLKSGLSLLMICVLIISTFGESLVFAVEAVDGLIDSTAGYVLTRGNLETNEYGTFEYSVDNGEASITGYSGEGGEVVIPSEVGGYLVTSIGNYAFSDCSNLTSIAIPDSVTSIGYQAFYACTGLMSIAIPDSVTYISEYAFDATAYYNDSSNWENNALYIGNHLIAVNPKITENYAIKVGTKTIANIALRFCDSLTSVAIPDSVTSIGWGAFKYCDSLTDVYYCGSEEDWNRIVISKNNECLTNATIHFTKESHTHAYTSEITIPATCTTTGTKTYTCTCGDSYTETIPATGHNSNTNLPAVSATCTATGKTAGKKCSVCGTITVAQRTVAKTAHKEVAIPAISATYTTEGKTAGKKCSVCNTVTVAQQTVAKLTLGKVSGLKAKTVKVAKSSEVTLSWNKIGDGVKYEVYQQNGKKWKKIKTTSKTSYTVKKLKSNKSYKFRVRAVVDDIKGKYSSTLTVKTVPATTSKLTLKAGKKQFTASWKSVSSISGYEVQYSTSKKFTKKTTKTVNVKKSAKKTTIKKLKKSKKYYVRLRTYKTVNGKKIYSSWSTVKNVKVK